MNTLEQQLKTKCAELGIELDMNADRIWLDAPPHHCFATNGTEYEHCIIPNKADWEFDNKGTSKKYNYNTERNETIRVLLQAIETFGVMAEDEVCEHEMCSKCHQQ
ncbi:hypothetical protein UFOVP1226_30 [uncultured Caudovirales phage]|uniref:Uncharacterized protein n=1 Tax=uncultured Caudovirales phage TaxID=2100421 RepID=A0A6J5RD11_9CAUD|nr:hypothetical protein UFOVP278_11 [uncultured Caudovirales phage]CAB4191341.1 hypothetical protein UFOVP1226_30 [uncultured Caudovirales phage]